MTHNNNQLTIQTNRVQCTIQKGMTTQLNKATHQPRKDGKDKQVSKTRWQICFATSTYFSFSNFCLSFCHCCWFVSQFFNILSTSYCCFINFMFNFIKSIYINMGNKNIKQRTIFKQWQKSTKTNTTTTTTTTINTQNSTTQTRNTEQLYICR